MQITIEMMSKLKNSCVWVADDAEFLTFAVCLLICARGAPCGSRKSLTCVCVAGVVNKIFSYDYSPMGEYVGRHRVFFNYSQEGKADIDTLRQALFIVPPLRYLCLAF